MEDIIQLLNKRAYNELIEVAKLKLSLKYNKDIAVYLVCGYIEIGSPQSSSDSSSWRFMGAKVID